MRIRWYVLSIFLCSTLVFAQLPKAPPLPVPSMLVVPPAVSSPTEPAPAMTGPELFARSKDAIFKVLTKIIGAAGIKGHGTGFAIDENGHLLTNYHVVASALERPDKYQLEIDGIGRVAVVAIDAVNDLALVHAPGRKFAVTIPIPQVANPTMGETVFSIGFPKSEKISIAQGTFNGSSYRGFVSLGSASLALNPGMSGGPALNARGELLGVNRAIMLNAQNISYFSDLKDVRKFISENLRSRNRMQLPPSLARTQVQAGIAFQEKLILMALERVPAKVLESQEQIIGGVHFTPVIPMSCGQDFNGAPTEQRKDEFIICQTGDSAFIANGVRALELIVAATNERTGFIQAPGDAVLGMLKSRDRTDKDYKERAKEIGVKLARENCRFMNVTNRHGMTMLAHACSRLIPAGGEELYTTYLRVNVRAPSGKYVDLAHKFEGFTLGTSMKLMGKFLDSIHTGGKP